jgi:hypothetical protein
MRGRVFSQRCKEVIAQGRLATNDLTDRTRRKVWRVLAEFDAPCRVPASRYDSLEIHSEASTEVRGVLLEVYEGERDSLPKISEEYVLSAPVPDVFDVLEVWSDFLWEPERHAFERALNEVFGAERCSWLIADTRIFRIDRDFVEAEIIEPIFNELLADQYRGALDELSAATAEFTAGDYKASIQAAAKSSESVMKVILGVSKGTASQLVRGLRGTALFSDLPADVAGGLPESVFMSLAFLRNNLAGHGQGASVLDVPARYALLAIHLAAVHNLFLVRAAADMSKSNAQPPTVGSGDDVPF